MESSEPNNYPHLLATLPTVAPKYGLSLDSYPDSVSKPRTTSVPSSSLSLKTSWGWIQHQSKWKMSRLIFRISPTQWVWLPSPSLWPLCLDLRIADTCKKFILGHFPGNCTRISLSAWRNSPPFHILSIFCSPTGKTTNDHWGRRLTFSNIEFLGAFAFCSKWKRMSWETVKDLSN